MANFYNNSFEKYKDKAKEHRGSSKAYSEYTEKS